MRPEAAEALAAEHGAVAARELDELLALQPDVVVVATSHDRLAPIAVRALEAGATCSSRSRRASASRDVDRIAAAAAAAGRVVKVGFNHRFHPGDRRRRPELALSGRFGDVHVRARPLRPRRPARLRPRVARRPGDARAAAS